MDRYAFAYKVGSTPWERHATATRTSTAAILDREEAARSRPLGRAIDVGCGRGLYTCELATRGWQAVGIDFVPRAINAASRRGDCGASFVVGDVTDLASGDLGTFDLFLDIGCFRACDPSSNSPKVGESLPWPTRVRLCSSSPSSRPGCSTATGGASRTDGETAVPGWEILSVEPANTAGLGWPLTRTALQWFRLRWLAQV